MRKLGLLALISWTFAGAIATSMSATAHIHRGSDGSVENWYPSECCHNGDCHPVSRIQDRPDGFLMTTDDGTTLWVGFQRARRPSHDSRWHVCFGSHEVHEVVCVFEPPGS
jgi:hypothetical protein